MRADYHMAVLVLLGVVFALQLSQSNAVKTVFVASGGGIRAAIGTNLAIDMLKETGMTFDEYHALSGGSWGLAMSLLQIPPLVANGAPAPPMPTWCDALAMSLKDKKAWYDPRKVKQTSHKVIGPRSASNPVDGVKETADERWWSYWHDYVGKFTQAPDRSMLTMRPPVPKVFIHVAQLTKQGTAATAATNDCWLTNLQAVTGVSATAKDFQCCFDHQNPEADFATKSASKKGTPPVSATTQTKLLDALTYSSSAWSTLQAKVGTEKSTKIRFRRKTPPFKVSNTQEIQLTDGGDWTNLPLYSVINDFFHNPQDTDVMAFDYTEPDADVSYCTDKKAKDPCDPSYDMAFTMGQIHDRLVIDSTAKPIDMRFKPEEWSQIDECEGHALWKSGNFKLTVRFIGFCGPKAYKDKAGKGPLWLIDQFRTIEITKGAVVGKGLAKQWDQSELDVYVKQYGDFLKERLDEFSSAAAPLGVASRDRLFAAMKADKTKTIAAPQPCSFR